jgi:glycine/D-amino acid oxidase-like deaminating enzyme/nitrite reductase/ring-hydroxylating ferredoxin subunit
MELWPIAEGARPLKSVMERSYWNATAAPTAFPTLTERVQVDVAVIGGGIVGVTTARALKSLGLTVALVEAKSVGRGVTGRSTAKVTSQHHLIYQTLEKKFDADTAKLYAEAQEAGIRHIQSLAREHAIACDIEPQAAYIYTLEEKYVEQLETEADIAGRLGLPARIVKETGLPFQVLAALRFDNQAQFHPTKYVAGLAETIPGDGSHVFEHSRVTAWEPTRVTTDRGHIVARHVVMATHLPLGQLGGYYTRAHPHAEPVLAARVGHIPNGMYLSAETPAHSIRTHTQADGSVYGIVAGPEFRPGATDDERKQVAELESWFSAHFQPGPIEYRWVNEDYASIDQAPFIGWSASHGDRYLVATGFGAWGITNGTVAGLILADLAAGRDNRWAKIFDAARLDPKGGAATFVKENVHVAGHLVGGYLSRKLKDIDELGRGEAAIMKIDGANVAVFKDEQGHVHSVSAVCSHMGCLVGWNETDRTWDCPCHGSRFGLTGDVIHGPATKPLGSGITG